MGKDVKNEGVTSTPSGWPILQGVANSSAGDDFSQRVAEFSPPYVVQLIIQRVLYWIDQFCVTRVLLTNTTMFENEKELLEDRFKGQITILQQHLRFENEMLLFVPFWNGPRVKFFPFRTWLCKCPRIVWNKWNYYTDNIRKITFSHCKV